MALADFQTLWTEQIKPAIPSIAGTSNFATTAESEAAANELT